MEDKINEIIDDIGFDYLSKKVTSSELIDVAYTRAHNTINEIMKSVLLLLDEENDCTTHVIDHMVSLGADPQELFYVASRMYNYNIFDYLLNNFKIDVKPENIKDCILYYYEHTIKKLDKLCEFGIDSHFIIENVTIVLAGNMYISNDVVTFMVNLIEKNGAGNTNIDVYLELLIKTRQATFEQFMILINTGANPRYSNDFLLADAVSYCKDKRIIEYLVNTGCRVKGDMLLMTKDLDILKLLLDTGVKIDTVYINELFKRNEHQNIQLLIDYGYDAQEMINNYFKSVFNTNSEIFKLMLDCGVDFNHAVQYTPKN